MENRNAVLCSAAVNRAISFILEHLNEEITVDDVAQHCGYSRYHLTRLFREETGEAVYQFMKRLRLERSAWQLKVEKRKSITEIGVNCGYSSSNFATAFKKHLHLSPIDYRRKSEQIVQQSAFAHGISLDELERAEGLLTVEWLHGFLVVYERKRGNYHHMAQTWRAFMKKYERLASPDTVYVDCTIDDPSITDENSCLYELCQTISPDHPALRENTGILTHRFEGGKYAVYHFRGFPQFLFMVYQEIFCRWLTRTGNQLDDRPIFDLYRRVNTDGAMEIDICFPLK